jgi:hypothetical protein
VLPLPRERFNCCQRGSGRVVGNPETDPLPQFWGGACQVFNQRTIEFFGGFFIREVSNALEGYEPAIVEFLTQDLG